MISNYEKRPVTIEAIQITDELSFKTAVDWMNRETQQCTYVIFDAEAYHQSSITIHTEGNMIARPWDWIIKGVQGEFYPCRPEIFDVTYKEVRA
jgi:hypothetical protein